MSRAGFVLAGGKSSRMGRDKALLPFRGSALISHVAGTVAAAAGSAVLVGDPEKYGALGYAVIPDLHPGAGPLGGIETALRYTGADWNLVLACDMPGIEADFLRGLLEAAEHLATDALIPHGPNGRPEPLCAVYHRRCGEAIGRAFDVGIRKVTVALASLEVAVYGVIDPALLKNLNTPEEWARYDAH